MVISDNSAVMESATSPIWCQMCLLRFDSTSQLNDHVIQCPSTVSFNKQPPKRMKIRPAQNPRIFKCERLDCGMRFTRWTNLKRHMLTHTGEKPYPCEVEGCGKRFSQLGNLHTHMYTHTGERPYQCSKCPKAYNQSTALKRHMRCHTGEKPFTCPQCGKNFTNSTHLSTHLRTHTGERPFQCDFCGKKFTQHSSLYIHMRSHIAMATQQPDLVTSQAFMTSPAGSMTSLDTKPSPICNLCFLPFPDIACLEEHVMRTHADKFDNNISVQLASSRRIVPYQPLQRSVITNHGDVTTRKRDVSSTQRDVMPVQRDAMATDPGVNGNTHINITSRHGDGLTSSRNTLVHDVRSRDLSGGSRDLPGCVGKPAFPTGNFPCYPSSSSSIVSPIAVYPSANRRRLIQSDNLTPPSSKVTSQSHHHSLLTSPPFPQNFSRIQSFHSPRSTRPSSFPNDVTPFSNEVTSPFHTVPPASPSEMSPQNEQYLALSSLLILSNLVATTTAAMQFSVAKNS